MLVPVHPPNRSFEVFTMKSDDSTYAQELKMFSGPGFYFVIGKMCAKNERDLIAPVWARLNVLGRYEAGKKITLTEKKVSGVFHERHFETLDMPIHPAPSSYIIEASLDHPAGFDLLLEPILLYRGDEVLATLPSVGLEKTGEGQAVVSPITGAGTSRNNVRQTYYRRAPAPGGLVRLDPDMRLPTGMPEVRFMPLKAAENGPSQNGPIGGGRNG